MRQDNSFHRLYSRVHVIRQSFFRRMTGLIMGGFLEKQPVYLVGFHSSMEFSDDILAKVLTVFQFRVVASTESAFSIVLLESFVRP